MADGSMTIRYSETKPIPFDFSAQIGRTVTINSATVSCKDSNGLVIFSNRSTTAIEYPIPSTGSVYFNYLPQSDTLTIGDDYYFTCTADVTVTITTGNYNDPGRECVVKVTILSEFE